MIICDVRKFLRGKEMKSRLCPHFALCSVFCFLQTAFVFVSTDPLTLSFKSQAGDLQFNIFLNQETCQNLVLKVNTEQPERWAMEDTSVSLILQHFPFLVSLEF
jgi:hypothetical protein